MASLRDYLQNVRSQIQALTDEIQQDAAALQDKRDRRAQLAAERDQIVAYLTSIGVTP